MILSLYQVKKILTISCFMELKKNSFCTIICWLVNWLMISELVVEWKGLLEIRIMGKDY